ncbi:rho GDP-dissociation inhibitor 2-like [Rhinoraja longicauda]
MLGLDVCELGGQLLELVWLAVCYRDASVPNVQVTHLSLVCPTARLEPIVMDLTALLKKKAFVLKEGVEYRLKINFKVNKEIVSGLKYVHYTCKGRLQASKDIYMLGSYGPRVAEYEFVSPVEEVPRGVMVRGAYTMKSHFTDDDKCDHLHWEWKLSIKKDWEE